MKNNWVRYLAVSAMAGGMLLAAGADVSSPPPPAVQQHLHGSRYRGARLARYLNLTAAQQAQAKADRQAARQSAQPLRQQLKQVRQQMFQAIRANDAGAIQQLSAQEGSLKGQLAALRHATFAKLYSSLTPDQRAKADQLPAHFRQMRQRRIENRQAQSNG